MDILTTNSPVSSNRFIKANTETVTLSEIENHHIIPVFSKDNQLAISHSDFIKNVFDAVHYVHSDQLVLPPSIRVSHPVQGRIPDARDKQPHELLDHEKTLYYERMMFAIEIPSIVTRLGDQHVNLVVGGVKSYHKDKLSGKLSDQTFKIYVGFKVNVCSNLCVSTDGSLLEIKTKHPDTLFLVTIDLLESFDQQRMLERMSKMQDQILTRIDFEQLMGTLRVSFYEPNRDTNNWLGDQQMGQVVRGYFDNPDFKANPNGDISLWNVYNLLTEANKSSYIDNALERSAWCFNLMG